MSKGQTVKITKAIEAGEFGSRSYAAGTIGTIETIEGNEVEIHLTGSDYYWMSKDDVEEA